VPPPVAAGTLFWAGLAIIGGRMISGWCLDRVWGSWVAICFFALSMIGLAILASGATGASAIVGAALCGAGIGAEVDLMGFLMSRYFGMKAFGKIYGLMFFFFNIGTGLGPFLSGKTFDAYKSYAPILYFYIGVLAVVCAVLLTLGSYAYKPADEKA
jgi:predicted MFS family arabinose efflux permease